MLVFRRETAKFGNEVLALGAEAHAAVAFDAVLQLLNSFRLVHCCAVLS